MNRSILLGRLTKDPELRYTQNGTAVCTFTLAVNRRKKEDGADFLSIVVWSKLAELCAQYLKKGRQAAVDGRIQTRNYDDKDGKKVYVTEIVAENVTFIGGQGDGGNSGSSGDNPFGGDQKPVDISDDDLPF